MWPVEIGMSSISSGYFLSGLCSVLLLVDGVGPTPGAGDAFGIWASPGVIEVIGLVLYLTPSTSALGALLLTAYLGGITAIHAGSDQVTRDVVFPIYVGLLMWTGLFVRDAPLRTAVFRWSSSR
jgi:hypothetical protein